MHLYAPLLSPASKGRGSAITYRVSHRIGLSRGLLDPATRAIVQYLDQGLKAEPERWINQYSQVASKMATALPAEKLGSLRRMLFQQTVKHIVSMSKAQAQAGATVDQQLVPNLLALLSPRDPAKGSSSVESLGQRIDDLEASAKGVILKNNVT